MNKKVKDLARKSALSHKVKEKSLFIIENFDLKQPKTKEFVPVIEGFESEVIGVLFLSHDIINRIKTIIILKGFMFFIISAQI